MLGEGKVHFRQSGRGGFTEKVTFEQRPEEGQRTHRAEIWENIPGTGNSICKGPAWDCARRQCGQISMNVGEWQVRSEREGVGDRMQGSASAEGWALASIPRWAHWKRF